MPGPGNGADDHWPLSVIEPSGRMRTPGGPSVAWYDLGGEGPPLLLVHATGFCAATLAPMARLLTARFHCVAIDQRAHGASEPPADGDFSWHGFAEDTLAAVEALGLEHPFAFGHSSGGAAVLLAEEAEPGTFAGLYCYEPVVYPGEVPLEPSLEANPLAAGAMRRRSRFSGRAEALASFSSRPPFDRLDPAALAAYVDNGFTPDRHGGIRLRCRREDEAQMYAQFFSHDTFARLDEVRCPVTLACGAQTDAIGPALLDRFAARIADCEQVVLPGLTHFGPLEEPASVADSILGSVALRAAGAG